MGDYPICDDIDGDNNDKNEDEESKRRRRFKNCKCYKLGITDCINAPQKNNKMGQSIKKSRKQQKKKHKIKSKSPIKTLKIQIK